MRGYKTHIAQGSTRIAVLIKKHYTTQQHQINHRIERTLIELVPPKKTLQSFYILNVYSPPRDTLKDVHKFLKEMKKVTNGQKLLVVGDFNAPHVAWGYRSTTKKGTDVHNVAEHHQLTMWPDPLILTIIGNSVSRDTSQDLTFSTGLRQVEWSRLDETLGSDHHIIQTEIMHHKTPVRLGEDFSKRWEKQKRNHKLKIPIAAVSRHAEEYAEKLGRQNWNQVCHQLQGTLRNRKTGAILKILLAKTESKIVTTQHMQSLIHNFQGTEEVREAITGKYIGDEQERKTQPVIHPEYEGEPDPDLYQPFTKSEIVAALRNLTRNTMRGRHKINNKTLRNLDDGATDSLLKYINECWETGSILASWRHADVTMIPRPGKPINLQNLRPISLKSCAGKLFEHMVHNRLSPYLEEDDLAMWTCTVSVGEQQDALQEAIDRTENYLHRCGLSCAPEKSELLILKKRTRGRPPQETPDLTLTLHGVNIPKVDTLCQVW
ncbi:uncharacterized protein [Dermacentor andersoni]|uniref:uncharacterized protein n=1 Tax=Dermacentor andersoni TaxID=34620 RepID=UPI003B3B25DD